MAPDEKKGATFSSTVTLTRPSAGNHRALRARRDQGRCRRPDAVDDLGDATAVGRFDPRGRALIGDQIEIAVNTINLHFFDAEPHRHLVTLGRE